MNQIREACSEIASGYQPGVTYIIVSKRHHTHFFPLDPRDKVCLLLFIYFCKNINIHFYYKTGKCRFSLAKLNSGNVRMSFALKKNS